MFLLIAPMVVLVVGVVVAAMALGAVRLSRSGTDRVRVSVDDLAVGRVPPICVKTGEPTFLRAEVESADGFQPWWLLLLLLGPLGVVGLVVLWVLARRTLRVGGELPFSRSALDDYNRAARLARNLFGLAVAGMILGVGALAIGPGTGGSFLGVAAIATLVLAGLASVGARAVARWRWVDVELDGSGRWAVLVGVHPRFAAAVREQRLSEQPGRGL